MEYRWKKVAMKRIGRWRPLSACTHIQFSKTPKGSFSRFIRWSSMHRPANKHAPKWKWELYTRLTCIFVLFKMLIMCCVGSVHWSGSYGVRLADTIILWHGECVQWYNFHFDGDCYSMSHIMFMWHRSDGGSGWQVLRAFFFFLL